MTSPSRVPAAPALLQAPQFLGGTPQSSSSNIQDHTGRETCMIKPPSCSRIMMYPAIQPTNTLLKSLQCTHSPFRCYKSLQCLQIYLDPSLHPTSLQKQSVCSSCHAASEKRAEPTPCEQTLLVCHAHISLLGTDPPRTASVLSRPIKQKKWEFQAYITACQNYPDFNQP